MGRKSGGFFGRNVGIRQTIYLCFTVSALAAIALIGISLWGRLSRQFSETLREENQMLMRQVNLSVDSWLRQAMKLSDSLYYGVIKNADVTSEQVNGEMTLLYNNNRDSVANIALFSEDGELLSAVPATRMKDGYDVCAQEWFEDALERTDNLHFTTPHVQHIFDNNDSQYRWVISMSRSVELINGTSTEQGVLLVDMSYTSLRQLLENIRLVNGGYLYLVGGTGEMIYHPQMQLLGSGFSEFEEEGAGDVSSYRDGSYLESVRGEKRDITVRTVGYTGWRLIGVVPERGVALNNQKTTLFMVFLVALFLFILILINALISSMITTPIRNLEKSVNAIEEGNLEAEVYVGGSYEIRHLGRSIGNMTSQIRKLMSDIVAEHEAKRKSDFAMLQAQINPHFLYNTLDILVWMIENGQKEEAAQVVTALARFFRISLSGGRSIIPVRDELEHVRNYLMIQQKRFKHKFTYEIEAEPETLDLASLKLTLQPLAENAVYHGVECMDGDGRITVRAFLQDGQLVMSVEDNGLGMTEEQVERIFASASHPSSRRSSGIGVKNVQERIRLYFGEEYGLAIESEPDEGTRVLIRLPAVPYEEDMGGEEEA